MHFKPYAVIFTFFILPLMSLSAHPHMWIQGTVTPVLGPAGLTAVDITWSFDEYSNSQFINDYDTNADGQIDASETETIRRESLSLLYESEYYLVVDIEGLRGTALEATGFAASVEEGQLSYSFRVPLEITIRWEDIGKVGIYLFDPTYFIDFRSTGTEDLTLSWEDRTVVFSAAIQEIETQGYGKVTVAGLQAGYNPATEPSGKSFSSLIKDSSFRLQEKLASFTRRVIDERDRKSFLIAMGLSVIFGLVHVLGPGHGKVFTLAYFSSGRARLREGLALSALINVMDSISAFLLVGITYGVLSLTIQNTGAAAGRITRIVAYGMITLMGVVHVIMHFLHDEHGQTRHRLKPWMLAISVGLVPCPVSSALLAYGMAEGAFWFSILLVAGVSLGGMIALTIYSFLIIAGKAGLVRVMENHGFTGVLEWFEVLAMLAMTVTGAVLLTGVLL